jgi:hypothetical protein
MKKAINRPIILQTCFVALVFSLFTTVGIRANDSIPQEGLHAEPFFYSIFALDTNTVWVGGTARDISSRQRSTLIYVTNDGGKIWHRKGPSISNSAIFCNFSIS